MAKVKVTIDIQSLAIFFLLISYTYIPVIFFQAMTGF